MSERLLCEIEAHPSRFSDLERRLAARVRQLERIVQRHRDEGERMDRTLALMEATITSGPGKKGVVVGNHNG